MNKIIKGSALAGFVALVATMGIVAASIDDERPKSNVSMRNLDLDDQLNYVDHIVVGLVKEVVSPYADPNAHPEIPRYFGDVIVIVEEELRGSTGENEITVRTHHHARQASTFIEGERALLFLIPGQPDSVEGEGVYVVSGMYQGKYDLDESTNRLVDPKNDEKTYRLSEIKAKIANWSQ